MLDVFWDAKKESVLRFSVARIVFEICSKKLILRVFGDFHKGVPLGNFYFLY